VGHLLSHQGSSCIIGHCCSEATKPPQPSEELAAKFPSARAENSIIPFQRAP